MACERARVGERGRRRGRLGLERLARDGGAAGEREHVLVERRQLPLDRGGDDVAARRPRRSRDPRPRGPARSGRAGCRPTRRSGARRTRGIDAAAEQLARLVAQQRTEHDDRRSPVASRRRRALRAAEPAPGAAGTPARSAPGPVGRAAQHVRDAARPRRRRPSGRRRAAAPARCFPPASRAARASRDARGSARPGPPARRPSPARRGPAARRRARPGRPPLSASRLCAPDAGEVVVERVDERPERQVALELGRRALERERCRRRPRAAPARPSSRDLPMPGSPTSATIRAPLRARDVELALERGERVAATDERQVGPHRRDRYSPRAPGPRRARGRGRRACGRRSRGASRRSAERSGGRSRSARSSGRRRPARPPRARDR